MISALDARILLAQKQNNGININSIDFEDFGKHLKEEVEKAIEAHKRSFSVVFERNNEKKVREILSLLGYSTEASCYDDKNPDYIELFARF